MRDDATGRACWVVLVALAVGMASCAAREEIACTQDLEPCPGGYCLNGRCDPGSDDWDADGLANADEFRTGSDPLHWDTDGDGVPDGEEVGPDPLRPRDTDGDRTADVVESAIADRDQDCVPDQFDAHDDDPRPPGDLVAQVNCSRKGVCGAAFALVIARCEAGVASCDYSLVPGYREDEDLCDGQDNDCDGEADEGFTLDGVPVGMGCVGVGRCGTGVVECAEDGTGTRCSTMPGGSHDASLPEACNGADDDCDGETDEGMTMDGMSPGGPCTAKGVCGPGVVECGPGGEVVCSSGPGGSQDRSSPEVCNGADDDCDGETDEDAPVSGNPLEFCKPVGVCATQLDRVRLVCRDGKPACDFAEVPGYSGGSEGLCDGLDDDCDGLVDEDFAWVDPFGRARTVGEPCGLGACTGGTIACAKDGLSATCSTQGHATSETCNESDDDCDGLVDDGWPKAFEVAPVILDPGVPSPRARAALAACPGGDALFLYGGVGRVGPDGGVEAALGDFWRYDLKAHRFVPVAGLTPGPRVGANLVCEGERLLLVGGLADGSAEGEVWSFSLDFQDWSPLGVSVPAGGSIGATVEGGVLVVVRTDPPGAALVHLDGGTTTPVTPDLPFRARPAFAPGPGGLYVHGGWDETGQVRGDLFWVAAEGGVAWMGSSFPERARHALAALADGSLLLFGGVGGDGEATRDAFLIRPGDGAVQPLAMPSLVPALMDPSLASTGDAVFLYSGLSPKGRGFRKVLRFDPATGGWTTDSLDWTPGPRAGGAIAVWRARGMAYLVGGYATDVGATYALPDVWAWSLFDGGFQRLATEGAEVTLILGALAMDETKGTLYWYGGLDRPPGPGAIETATYSRLDPAAGVVESLGDGAPGPRALHSLIAAGGTLLMYGGRSGGEVLGDVWGWTEAASWFRIDALPLPRAGHAAFWDQATGRMLVVAGSPGGDVAAFDPLSRTWMSLAAHPGLLDEGGMAFFDADSRVVLYVPSTGQEAIEVVLPLQGEPRVSSRMLAAPVVQAFSAYDPFSRRAVVFGGLAGSGGGALSVLWSLGQQCPAGPR